MDPWVIDKVSQVEGTDENVSQLLKLRGSLGTVYYFGLWLLLIAAGVIPIMILPKPLEFPGIHLVAIHILIIGVVVQKRIEVEVGIAQLPVPQSLLSVVNTRIQDWTLKNVIHIEGILGVVEVSSEPPRSSLDSNDPHF